MKYANQNLTSLIPLGTVTKATKAQKLLALKGIKSYIEKNTDKDGCMYSLRVDNRSYTTALTVLKRGK